MSALVVTGYAVASAAECPPFPAARVVALPPPGEHPRRARLPTLATALARTALGEEAAPAETAVLLGTALGSLTETEAFVRQMIVADEAAPKPRAFSASVHNAAAAAVAQALGARGESRTIVHGPASGLQALLLAERRAARGGAAPALVGGVDEVIEDVTRAWGACGPGGGPPLEGGAVLRLDAAGASAPLACLEAVSCGAAPANEADALVLAPRAYAAWGGGLAGGPALACAAAVALLSGELDPAWFALTAAPSRVVVVATPRWGESWSAVWSRP